MAGSLLFFLPQSRRTRRFFRLRLAGTRANCQSWRSFISFPLPPDSLQIIHEDAESRGTTRIQHPPNPPSKCSDGGLMRSQEDRGNLPSWDKLTAERSRTQLMPEQNTKRTGRKTAARRQMGFSAALFAPFLHQLFSGNVLLWERGFVVARLVPAQALRRIQLLCSLQASPEPSLRLRDRGASLARTSASCLRREEGICQR